MSRDSGRTRQLVAAAALVACGAGAIPFARGSALTIATTDYLEMCDASAAVAIGPDQFIVANDEDNTLRAYTVGTGTPLFGVPLDEFLGAKREADIEGAARVGDRIYWISSHGRNKEGKPRPDRLNFFATRIVTTGGKTSVETEGTPFKELLRDVIQPVLAARGLAGAATLAPESKGGLNIEGLAASGSGLLIGFRNPLIKGKALVVELTNPAELIADPKAKAKTGHVFELDLGGRGIRSIEALPASGGFAIVAGSFDDSPNPAFFRWSGKDEAPVKIDVPPLKSFNPEALFVDAGASATTPSSSTPSAAKLFLLSDDGDVPVGGVPCKEQTTPSLKRFKLATLTLD